MISSFRQTFVLLVAMSGFLPLSQTAADPHKYEALITEAMEISGHPGVSVAVVREGEPDFLKGFGVRASDDTLPVNDDTMFYTASLTKLFVATGIGTVVTAGELNFNDRVVDYDPRFRLSDPWVTNELTFADTLSHRVCLTPQVWPADVTIDYIHARIHLVPQGERFRANRCYSQTESLIALGILADGEGGAAALELIEERVLAPLGMTRTVTDLAPKVKEGEYTNCFICTLDHPPIGLDALKSDKNIAIPHYKSGDTIGQNYLHSNTGIWSSAKDMASFMKLYLGTNNFDRQGVLSPDVIKQMTKIHNIDPLNPLRANLAQVGKSPEDIGLTSMHMDSRAKLDGGWGLGWEVSYYGGRQVLFHGGASPGFRSQMYLAPEEGLGILVMTNMRDGSFDLARSVATEILEQELGIPSTDWIGSSSVLHDYLQQEEQKTTLANDAMPIVALEESAENFVGTFENRVSGEVVVSLNDGKLQLNYGLGRNGELIYRGQGRLFDLSWNNMRSHELEQVQFLYERGRDTASKLVYRDTLFERQE